MRTNVYIDGFNLYYGLKYYERHGRLYKWLDLAALCAAELPGSVIGRICYCTARVQPRSDPQQPQRQQAYLRALQTRPNLDIHYGRFIQENRWMPQVGSNRAPLPWFRWLELRRKAQMSIWPLFCFGTHSTENSS
jgi:hypothetical protein